MRKLQSKKRGEGIQIQHLLKLNFIISFVPTHHIIIQIQHLLKLNKTGGTDGKALIKFKYNTC